MKTYEFDAADYIESPEAVVEYLNIVAEENDSAAFYAAIGTVARSKGMTEISKKTGLSRESLYKALREDGNPSFATVCKVLGALGLRLTVTKADEQLATT